MKFGNSPKGIYLFPATVSGEEGNGSEGNKYIPAVLKNIRVPMNTKEAARIRKEIAGEAVPNARKVKQPFTCEQLAPKN